MTLSALWAHSLGFHSQSGKLELGHIKSKEPIGKMNALIKPN